MKVSVAFDLSANGLGNYFTLDDSTKGVLDGATYVLAGDALVDLTARTRSVQIKRGRNRQLGRFTSGAANLTFSNADRYLDPLFTATVGTRTNLFLNPSFEVDTGGWGTESVTLTRITTDSMFGSAAGSMTTTATGNVGLFTGSGNRAAANPSTTYTAFAYMRVPVGQPATEIFMEMRSHTAVTGGASVETFSGDKVAITSSDGWVRVSVSGTISATAYAINVRPRLTATAIGQIVYVDAILVEQSATLNPYFDGTSADGSIRKLTQAWNGTANASTSTITYYVDGTGSPYSGSIVPGKQVVIEHNGFPLYTGTVADWNLDYDLGGDNTAQASCTDGLASIANQLVTAGTATAQATGARVGAYLTDVGWPVASRSISTGAATLGADVIGANTNAITYLSAAVDSDPGALFVSKTGLMTFRDRNDLQAFTSGATFGPAAIPFTNIEVEYGVETLYPTVNVNYWGGTAVAQVSVSDSTAVTNYGNAELTVDTLLGSVTDATDLGNYLLGKYANPVYRINGLTVALHGLTSAQVNTVLALELGDMILVDGWSPGGVGAAISQYLTVEGIEHDADPSQHFVTFTLSQTLASFQLDSTSFGVLDTNRIGF